MLFMFIVTFKSRGHRPEGIRKSVVELDPNNQTEHRLGVFPLGLQPIQSSTFSVPDTGGPSAGTKTKKADTLPGGSQGWGKHIATLDKQLQHSVIHAESTEEGLVGSDKASHGK